MDNPMEQKGQHTPGPWFVDDTTGPKLTVDRTAGAATIGIWAQHRFDAAIDADDDEIEPDDEKWLCGVWGGASAEDFANARLIAAAPDMLETLIEIREDCIARSDRNGVVPIGRGAWMQLEASIAKAKGTTK